MNDRSLQVFLSGQGHVYYALIVAIGLTLAVLFGRLGAVWLALPLIAMGGVFADLWAHTYEH